MTLERLTQIKASIESEINNCDAISDEDMAVIENLAAEYKASLINGKREERAARKTALKYQLDLIEQLIKEEV